MSQLLMIASPLTKQPHQKVGLINLNKTGTEIIDINFGNILLIR